MLLRSNLLFHRLRENKPTCLWFPLLLCKKHNRDVKYKKYLQSADFVPSIDKSLTLRCDRSRLMIACNIYNLAYEVLSWKIQHTLIKAKLEPYLGFLHSTAEGKPSLICDFQELYLCLIDDFMIQYYRKLNRRISL